MSGGVDSCVAAALLQTQGYEVIGVTMRLWTLDDPTAAPGRQHCCSAEDAADAREVADLLGFPHYTLNLEQEFSDHVVDYFVDEYRRGRTPNPCLACNEQIKFRSLLNRALALEADYLATGHYARRIEDEHGFQLLRAADAEKDQSYVLYTLGQAELTRLLFPLGALTKGEVRAVARRLRLPVAGKPDSEEICFVPNNNYRTFLRERITPQPGEIVDRSGQVLGQHSGIIDYTVGQRRGLGAFGDRRYVVELLPAERRVVVGGEDELYCCSFSVERVNWVSGTPPPDGLPVTVKIRYKAPLVPAALRASEAGFEARFEQPQRSVTPGQAAVFYVGERVLGGGIIDRAGGRAAWETGL